MLNHRRTVCAEVYVRLTPKKYKKKCATSTTRTSLSDRPNSPHAPEILSRGISSKSPGEPPSSRRKTVSNKCFFHSQTCVLLPIAKSKGSGTPHHVNHCESIQLLACWFTCSLAEKNFEIFEQTFTKSSWGS